MRNILLLVTTLIFVYISLSACNKKCDGNIIYFGLIYGNRGDSLKIYLDTTLKVTKYIEGDYSGFFESKEGDLFETCLEKDSVFVHVFVNDRDTSFFLKPAEISQCYVGADIAGSIHVYFDRINGGFGGYDPKR